MRKKAPFLCEDCYHTIMEYLETMVTDTNPGWGTNEV
jgi:hypothetical protein